MERPALRNATYFWLAAIPVYGLSLLVFYAFYKKGHVWKTRGVVVGFEFDSSLLYGGRWVVPLSKAQETKIETDEIKQDENVEDFEDVESIPLRRLDVSVNVEWPIYVMIFKKYPFLYSEGAISQNIFLPFELSAF